MLGLSWKGWIVFLVFAVGIATPPNGDGLTMLIAFAMLWGLLALVGKKVSWVSDA